MSPSIGPASIHLCYSSWRYFPPALSGCYGCLRKIRRRHYHINRAPGTRRTGNLSSSSSMEARSNRTSDTFGVTSEGQPRTVRRNIWWIWLMIYQSEPGEKEQRRVTWFKLTIETSLPTWIQAWTDPQEIEADQHCHQQWKWLTYNANTMGRKQCTCKHSSHTNVLIKSFIHQDDEHINVVADDTGIVAFFWL